MDSIDVLGAAKYLSVTTYRRDGSAVATPVWVVRDGESLRVITGAESGKVKRIRSNPAVLVAPCDSRGRLRGAQVPARAVLEDDEGTRRTMDLVRQRYRLLGRILLRRQAADTRVGVTITLEGDARG